MATKNNGPSPPLAVAYLRVSTSGQANGPEVQRRSIEQWAKREGVTIAAWFEDIGVSGSVPVADRPGLREAVDSIRAHKAGYLVVHSRDRLARSVVVAAVATACVEQAGAQLVASNGAGNGSEPEDVLMRVIIDAFSQFERAKIRQRTSSALRALKRRGRKFGGTAPYGWAFEGRNLVPSPEEQKIRAIIFAMRKRGDSLAAIVKALEAAKVPSRGGGNWWKTTIDRILKYEPSPAMLG